MYEYEFVKIDFVSSFMKKIPKEHYQDVIIEYAKKGWRFKQIFAPATKGHGTSEYFELIFERKIGEPME